MKSPVLAATSPEMVQQLLPLNAPITTKHRQRLDHEHGRDRQVIAAKRT
jgi:hypothetical protein